MDPGVPRAAIAAFEWATGLQVALRDFRGALLPYLDAHWAEHTTDFCRRTKDSRHRACIAFCAERVPREVCRWAGGAVIRCHAGAVELVVPMEQDGRLEWLLFAGQRRAGPDLAIACEDAQVLPPMSEALPGLPPLGQAEATHLLELLRQLAVRLATWQRELGTLLPDGGVRIQADDRRRLVSKLIGKRHGDPALRLADLASDLGLSEDRAGHLVHELFGTGFAQLVQQERLRTARSLLALSRLPLREVARRSGFGSRSRFFAAFRAATGTSPAAFRRGRQDGG